MPDPKLRVDHESYTSCGGYRYQAVEDTIHAGPVVRLCVADIHADYGTPRDVVRPVSLEPLEAAEIGAWLLRRVVDGIRDPLVAGAIVARLDVVTRDLASVLADLEQ